MNVYTLTFRVAPSDVPFAVKALKEAVPTLKNAAAVLYTGKCNIPAEMLGAFTVALTPYLLDKLVVQPKKVETPQPTPASPTRSSPNPYDYSQLSQALKDIWANPDWPFTYRTPQKTPNNRPDTFPFREAVEQSLREAQKRQAQAQAAPQKTPADKTDKASDKTDKTAEQILADAEKRLTAAMDNFETRVSEDVDRRTARMLNWAADFLEKM